MPQQDQPPDQTPKIVELVSTLRARAAREKDPAEAQSLLDSAETFERADTSVRRSLADLQGAIDNAKSMAQEIRRERQLPWWVVATVLAGLLVFLYAMAVR